MSLAAIGADRTDTGAIATVSCPLTCAYSAISLRSEPSLAKRTTITPPGSTAGHDAFAEGRMGDVLAPAEGPDRGRGWYVDAVPRVVVAGNVIDIRALIEVHVLLTAPSPWTGAPVGRAMAISARAALAP